MVTPGKTYRVTMKHDGGLVEYFNYKAIKVEGSLVKFHNGQKEIIVNLAGPLFCSAEVQD